MLTVKVEYRLFRDEVWVKLSRDREIVNRWVFINKRTGADHQRIEIGRQNAIDVPLLDQLRNANMSPVYSRIGNISSYQVASFTRIKFIHAAGIALCFCFLVFMFEPLFYLLHEALGIRYSCRNRTAGTY